MSILHHQTTIECALFNGHVNVAFTSTGRGADLDLHVTEAWLYHSNGRSLSQAEVALTMPAHGRPMVELPAETFPLICNGAWDDLLDRAQRDRDPSLNAFLAAAE